MCEQRSRILQIEHRQTDRKTENIRKNAILIDIFYAMRYYVIEANDRFLLGILFPYGSKQFIGFSFYLGLFKGTLRYFYIINHQRP